MEMGSKLMLVYGLLPREILSHKINKIHSKLSERIAELAHATVVSPKDPSSNLGTSDSVWVGFQFKSLRCKLLSNIP
jgi:hypothetical protein